MNKDKMVLASGYEIEIESGASLSDIRVISDTKEDMLSVWGMMAQENLSYVQIKNRDGMTVGTHYDLMLVSETSSEKNGKVETSFNLRQKTDTEKRIDALENGQQTQDDAISDLGRTVSDIIVERSGQ